MKNNIGKYLEDKFCEKCLRPLEECSCLYYQPRLNDSISKELYEKRKKQKEESDKNRKNFWSAYVSGNWEDLYGDMNLKSNPDSEKNIHHKDFDNKNNSIENLKSEKEDKIWFEELNGQDLPTKEEKKTGYDYLKEPGGPVLKVPFKSACVPNVARTVAQGKHEWPRDYYNWWPVPSDKKELSDEESKKLLEETKKAWDEAKSEESKKLLEKTRKDWEEEKKKWIVENGKGWWKYQHEEPSLKKEWEDASKKVDTGDRKLNFSENKHDKWEDKRWWEYTDDLHSKLKKIGTTQTDPTIQPNSIDDKDKQLYELSKKLAESQIKYTKTINLHEGERKGLLSLINKLESENKKLKSKINLIENNPDEYKRRREIDPYDEENWE